MNAAPGALVHATSGRISVVGVTNAVEMWVKQGIVKGQQIDVLVAVKPERGGRDPAPDRAATKEYARRRTSNQASTCPSGRQITPVPPCTACAVGPWRHWRHGSGQGGGHRAVGSDGITDIRKDRSRIVHAGRSTIPSGSSPGLWRSSSIPATITALVSMNLRCGNSRAAFS